MCLHGYNIIMQVQDSAFLSSVSLSPPDCTTLNEYILSNNNRSTCQPSVQVISAFSSCAPLLACQVLNCLLRCLSSDNQGNPLFSEPVSLLAETSLREALGSMTGTSLPGLSLSQANPA